MPGQDLIFNIFARDRNAARTFRQVGRAADEAGKDIEGLRKSTLLLAAVTALPIVAPAVTSMMALSGAMAEGIAGMAVMKVGTVGMGAAFSAVANRDMKALDEAMAKLPPQAVGFVREFQKIAPELTEIRKATQSQLFAPLETSLDRLAGSYVPILRQQLPALAHDIGLVGVGFSTWLTTAPVLDSVQRIISHTGFDMLTLGRVVQNTGQAFLDLADTALPFTSKLFAAVERGTAGWRSWVTEAKRSGELSTIFSRTSDTMDALGQSISLIAKSIANVFANPNTVQAANNLIGVLNLGLKVVESLTSAFARLPDGMQGFILQAAAAGLIIKQLSGAFVNLTLLAATGLGRISIGMVGISRAMTAAHWSRDLEAMAGKIGLAAGAVLGLAFILNTVFQNAIKPVEHDVDSLAHSFVDLGRSSRITGEATRVVGEHMSVLFHLMDRIKNAQVTANATTLITSMVGKPSDTKAINQLKQNFKEIDQALTQLAQGGQANDAAAAFTNLREEWAKSGHSQDELLSKMPNYIEAQRILAAAALGAGKGFAVLSEKTRVMAEGLEAAVSEGRKLTDVFTLLNGGMVAFDHAQLAATEAIGALADSFQENGRALDGNSLKAQRNRVAIEDATQATVEAMQAKLEETGSIEQAEGVWERGTASIRDAAKAAGFNREQMAALNDVIGQMPPVKAAAISTPGATTATAQVSGLDDQIRQLKDKLAKINVVGPVSASSEVGQLRHQIDALESKRIQIITEFKYKGRLSGEGLGVGGVATGGFIGARGFAGGGFNGPVLGSGTGTSDSIPAMLSNGEYVIKAAAVASVGAGTLSMINRTGTVPAVGGGSTVNNYFTITASNVQDVVRELRKFVRIDGGGDVQTALGRT